MHPVPALRPDICDLLYFSIPRPRVAKQRKLYCTYVLLDIAPTTEAVECTAVLTVELTRCTFLSFLVSRGKKLIKKAYTTFSVLGYAAFQLVSSRRKNASITYNNVFGFRVRGSFRPIEGLGSRVRKCCQRSKDRSKDRHQMGGDTQPRPKAADRGGCGNQTLKLSCY